MWAHRWLSVDNEVTLERCEKKATQEDGLCDGCRNHTNKEDDYVRWSDWSRRV